MSYILDALKKSEAERSRGVVPTLLTPPQTAFRSGIVGWFLIAALVVNAALIAAWMYWPRETATTALRGPEPPPVATPPSTPTNAATHPKPGVAAPAPLETSASPPPVTVSPPSVATSPVQAQPEDTMSESDSGTADVSFSTHVYATDPSMRAVTMSGKRFVEGDEIRPGIRIREITETGVILDVNGRPIPVDVLQDWR